MYIKTQGITLLNLKIGLICLRKNKP